MGMYTPRALVSTSRDLHQGDILQGVLRPKPATSAALISIIAGKGARTMVPPAPGALQIPKPNLHLLCEVERLDFCIVVSNSCDNLHKSYPVLLAPVAPYAFRDEALSPSERWRDISEAATGTANPKDFYLPADPAFGLKRSEARLAELFPLTHDLLTKSMQSGGATRVCGLGPDALRHLQWAISLLYARDARDDEWESEEDLRLKLEWIKLQLAGPLSKSRLRTLEHERDATLTRLPGDPTVASSAASEGAAPVPRLPESGASSEGEAGGA